jgi:hypothetical protein
MQVEKYISYQIERQFPALYRETGIELVDFVKSYYDFLERSPNQGTYNSRRLFEYRDIDNTLEQLIVFFKNKYMSDLPYNDNSIRFIVKNILDLYRRKGNKESAELFFKMFYDETVKIYYPSVAMLKPSDSKWETQKYLQLFPESPLGFRNVVGGRIIGTFSKAEAVIEKAFFILLNKTIVPILYINNVRGEFTSYDKIVYKDITAKQIGVVYGSLNSAEVVDVQTINPTSGNKVGDILTVSSTNGIGAKLIVTGVSSSFSGEVKYTITNGGWGYSKENTLLLVSNQVIILDQEDGRQFNPFDSIQDQLANSGTVIGQNGTALGVRVPEGQAFNINSVLRDANNDIIQFEQIIAKNDSSPGPLFPEASIEELGYAVKVSELENTEIVSIITDIIGNFVNVPLDALNFSDSPAEIPMSGVDPVNLSTPLNQAFSTVTFEIGTIVSFENVSPGVDYINDVFAIAYDPVIASTNRKNQIVTYSGLSSLFSIGDLITQGGTTAKIVDVIENRLYVLPYNSTGIIPGSTFNHKGINYSISSVLIDYASKIAGNNAAVVAKTEFAVGRIENVKVVDAGFGYDNEEISPLVDSLQRVAVGAKLSVTGQGETEGSWKSFNSHIGVEFGKVIQDSFYYQDYSYEVQSNLNINSYERAYKDIVHVSGTKLFGKFNYEDAMRSDTRIDLTIDELRI